MERKVKCFKIYQDGSMRDVPVVLSEDEARIVYEELQKWFDEPRRWFDLDAAPRSNKPLVVLSLEESAK